MTWGDFQDDVEDYDMSGRYRPPSTMFRGRSPRFTWFPERHMCCDPKADIICPYNETWREYATRLLVCSWLGHRWNDLGTWLMCLRCRWFESSESRADRGRPPTREEA